ncbi:hypothetical protein GobsT_27310 [Gemmata obscuriglobus]|nr:hypothetical protein GobsT_27310 [Gemmata obscuriglobus]VTS05452.1 unnamed protein product [Gemmata obscuriglobus UQM 2246]
MRCSSSNTVVGLIGCAQKVTTSRTRARKCSASRFSSCGRISWGSKVAGASGATAPVDRSVAKWVL